MVRRVVFEDQTAHNLHDLFACFRCNLHSRPLEASGENPTRDRELRMIRLVDAHPRERENQSVSENADRLFVAFGLSHCVPLPVC